jgi:hypothetical protein
VSSSRGARFLVGAGVILLAVVLVDPLEGSILAIPGIAALAAGAHLAGSRFLAPLYGAAGLLVLGISTMWILSAFGGLGGDTGRSLWWALVLLPYPAGWLLGLATGFRVLREVRAPPAAA